MFGKRRRQEGGLFKSLTSQPAKRRSLAFEPLECRRLLAAPDVDCVPWRWDFVNDTYHPHETYDGADHTLKAVVKADNYPVNYTWDFGDGSPTVSGTINSAAEGYRVQATHAYAGDEGTPYIATLTVTDPTDGGATTDQYKVVIKPFDLQVQTNMAIDKGLWFFHKNMTRTTVGGEPAGYWQEGGYWQHLTGAAVSAFENEGHRPDGDLDENPYVETVQRGLNMLLNSLYVQNFSASGDPPVFSGSPYGDPDGNDNMFALSVSGGRQVYEIGPVMMAIAASATPERTATVGPAGVNGRLYEDILQDMVDMCAWGMDDYGGDRGGWRYSWNSGADNSATQWPTLGLEAAATADGFDIIIPEFVKPELERWFNYSQISSTSPSYDGCWGYTGPNAGYQNFAHAGAGIAGLTFVGHDASYDRIDRALDWLDYNWTHSEWGGQWFYNKYGLYAVMKGLRIAEVDELPSGRDWFADFASSLINGTYTNNPNYYKQQADGYWQRSSNWTNGYKHDTAWSLLALMPSVVSAPPVAILDVSPTMGPPGQVFTFDASDSFHLDPGKNIVECTIDFGDPATPPVVLTGPGDDLSWATATYVYPDTYESLLADPDERNEYIAELTVKDDGGEVKTARATQIVTLSLVNHRPVADAGGPYIAYQGYPLTLDGTGSYDPDTGHPLYNSITAYEWELDLEAPYGYDDATTNSPTWTWDTLGTFNIGLKVWDENGESDVDWTTVEVREGIPTVFQYKDRHVNYSDTANIYSWLKTETGVPIEGKSVNFYLDKNRDNSFDPVAEYIGTGTTNAEGYAETLYTSWDLPGHNYRLKAEFEGDGPYLPSAVEEELFFCRVDKENTVVEYTGVTSSATGETVTLEAVLKDDDGNVIAGKDLSFVLGSQSTAAVTDASGVGAIDLLLAQAAGNYSVNAAFAGDDYYVSATDTDPFAMIGLNDFDVQKGATQRSYIRYLDLIFENEAGLADLITDSRVNLTRYELDGSGGVAVGLTSVLSAVDNRIEFDFGAEGIGGNRNSSLGNGYYRVGLDLDGNGSYETEKYFYRLLGDVDGNKKVDRADIYGILYAYGSIGSGLDEDVNGDGVVNVLDRVLAMRSYGSYLKPTLHIDD